MTLAGSAYKDYTITVSGTVGDSTTAGTINSIPTTSKFILRVKNPCLDPEFVQIVPNDLTYVTYALGSFADTSPQGYQWEFAPFTVETFPVQHDHCGEISYEVKFKGEPVWNTPNSIPMQFDPANNVLTFFTNDSGLVGIHEYTVTAMLTKFENTADYGQDIIVTAMNNIVVTSPCAGLE